MNTFFPFSPQEIDHDAEFSILMPNGMETCDYWFIYENGLYHAFFLATEKFPDGQRIAHAISEDLKSWQYLGVVLEGYGNGGWPSDGLATGSVVKSNHEYFMLFTAHDDTNGGLGLAVSTDLYHWKKVGSSPVISYYKNYFAEYLGTKYECQVLADPYVFPERIDGWFYAYVNSWAIDRPYNSRGCQLMFRTKDFLNWEPYKIAILTDDLDRLETCQVWEHGGKWYMYFGGRRIDPAKGDFADIESDNYIYQSNRFDGPYTKKDWSKVKYESTKNCYIQKVIQCPGKDDTVMIMAPYHGVLKPQNVIYGTDGSVKFTVKSI